MRTYTGHYRGHTIVPRHIIDDGTARDPDPAQRIYFELDDGTCLVIRNAGTHVEVKATGKSDDLGKGAVHVIPYSSNVVYLQTGPFA